MSPGYQFYLGIWVQEIDYHFGHSCLLHNLKMIIKINKMYEVTHFGHQTIARGCGPWEREVDKWAPQSSVLCGDRDSSPLLGDGNTLEGRCWGSSIVRKSKGEEVSRSEYKSCTNLFSREAKKRLYPESSTPKVSSRNRLTEKMKRIK